MSWKTALRVYYFSLLVFTCGTAAAATIQLSKASAPPQTAVQVFGSGFGANEEAIVTFDGALVDGAVTDGKGTLYAARFKIPKLAFPGPHRVTVTGKMSRQRAAAVLDVNTSWSQQGFDGGRTFFNPYENVLSPANVDRLTLVKWALGTSRCLRCALLEAEGVLYFQVDEGGAMAAVDATTGNRLWLMRPDAASGAFIGNASLDRGMLYLRTARGYIRALDAASGAERWRVHIGKAQVLDPPEPLAANGEVYALGSRNGYSVLFALDGVTGRQAWSFGTAERMGRVFDARWRIFVQAEHNLYALDARSGALLWSTPGIIESVSVGSSLSESAILGYDPDYAHLRALSAASGATLWTSTVPYAPASHQTTGTDRIYRSRLWEGRHIDVFSMTDGARVATFRLPRIRGATITQISGMVLANGVLYVTARYIDNRDGFDVKGAYLFALDAKRGTLLSQSHASDSPYLSDPIVVNGTVYLREEIAATSPVRVRWRAFKLSSF